MCVFQTKIHNLGVLGGGLPSTPKLTLSRRLKPATLSPIISNPVQGQREIVWPHTPLSAWGVGVAKERKRETETGELLTGSQYAFGIWSSLGGHLRSRLQAHFSLEQMSTTLEDLVETAILLDYNERDEVGPWC